METRAFAIMNLKIFHMAFWNKNGALSRPNAKWHDCPLEMVIWYAKPGFISISWVNSKLPNSCIEIKLVINSCMREARR